MLFVFLPLTFINAAVYVLELTTAVFEVVAEAAVVLAAVRVDHHALSVLLAHVPASVVAGATRP